MCGIVGYVGAKAIDSVLLVGLQKLEYRGYDSAGIAVHTGSELVLEKVKGRITALADSLKTRKINGQAGIGHTRWATHGEPNQVNAHPHTSKDQTIAVVQNGIIENYLALKEELHKLGYVFTSETDTEVIPHLIDHYLRNGFDIQKAFVTTLDRLEGKYAIAMVYEAQPDSVFFARNGAPLIIAEGKGRSGKKELFLASDIPAIVPLAEKSYVLEDRQWGRLNGDIELFDFDGSTVSPAYEKIELTELDVDKGSYEHYMLKEIHEQPGMVRRILESRLGEKGRVNFDELKLSRDFLSRVARMNIQACGTSLNAGHIGRLYIEQLAKVSVSSDFSSEFRYRNPVLDGDTLVLGISQSGETADTLASLHEAKAKFLKVLSFVNNENSTMARDSDAVIHLLAGPEIGVASTKAYLAQLVNMLLFALHLSDLKWMLPKEKREESVQELRLLPNLLEQMLEDTTKIQEVAKQIKDCNSVLFLGRTYNYPTALEGALKLKEISYIHAEGYAAGEFKHGPIALVSDQVPVIVVAPVGEMRTKMISNLQEVKARKGKVIAIISEGDKEIQELADEIITIPQTSELLSPIISVIPLQLLAYYTAIERGCDVDKPRNLAKSVTVE